MARGSPLISALLHDQWIGKLPNSKFKGAASNGWLATDAAHLRLARTNLLNDLRLLILQSFYAGCGGGYFKAEDERNKKCCEHHCATRDDTCELQPEETRALR
jgi:hypothetical protein